MAGMTCHHAARISPHAARAFGQQRSRARSCRAFSTAAPPSNVATTDRPSVPRSAVAKDHTRMPIAVLKQAGSRPWKRSGSDDSGIDVAVLGKLRLALQRELGADRQQLGKVFTRQRAKLLSQLPVDGLGPRLRLWTEVMGQEYARMFIEAEPTLILLHPLTLLGSLEGVSQVLRLPPRRAVEYLMRHQYLVGVTATSIQQSLAVLIQHLAIAPEDAVTLCVQWGQVLYMRPDVLQQKLQLMVLMFAPESAAAAQYRAEQGSSPDSKSASGIGTPKTPDPPCSTAEPAAEASTSYSSGAGSSPRMGVGGAEGCAPATVRDVARMLLRRPQLLTKSTASLEQRVGLLAQVLELSSEEVKRMVMAQPAILGVDPYKAAARWVRLTSYSQQHAPWAEETAALLPWQKARALMLGDRDFHRLDWVLQQGLAGVAGGPDLAGVLFYVRKFLALHPNYVPLQPEVARAGLERAEASPHL